MLKKIDIRIPIIIVLSIILIILLCLYYKDDSSTNNMYNFHSFDKSNKTSSTEKTTYISTSTRIQSALTEYVDLHTTYYLSKLYVEENEKVTSGTKILKYTNGKYLKAPYDCIITSINLPDASKKITNAHYIQISSLNSLKMEFNIDESKISSISIGDTATITVKALDDKEYSGYVTDISNTANNGKFTVTVEFENDGNIMIGMTGTVTI